MELSSISQCIAIVGTWIDFIFDIKKELTKSGIFVLSQSDIIWLQTGKSHYGYVKGYIT